MEILQSQANAYAKPPHHPPIICSAIVQPCACHPSINHPGQPRGLTFCAGSWILDPKRCLPLIQSSRSVARRLIIKGGRGDGFLCCQSQEGLWMVTCGSACTYLCTIVDRNMSSSFVDNDLSERGHPIVISLRILSAIL